MGSIPGINIPTGIIKFFIHLNEEAELQNRADRANLERVAESTDRAAQETLKTDIKASIPNLKWYALLQVIPLVGIIFVLAEADLLKRLNFLGEVTSNETSGQINLPNNAKPKAPRIHVETPEEFDKAIDKDGRVAIYFHQSADYREKEYQRILEEEVDRKPDSTTLVYVNWTQQLDPIWLRYNVKGSPEAIFLENRVQKHKIGPQSHVIKLKYPD